MILKELLEDINEGLQHEIDQTWIELYSELSKDQHSDKVSHLKSKLETLIKRNV